MHLAGLSPSFERGVCTPLGSIGEAHSPMLHQREIVVFPLAPLKPILAKSGHCQKSSLIFCAVLFGEA